ncbi:hypothetical protein AVA37_23415 [Salmonella enterica subsp. enterica serovar Litchfield]|nr:hypothetical protein [Salmonella enterica subsp. enterica serovar Litchfield]
MLPFLPVCCRDRAERVLAVRTRDVMFNRSDRQVQKKALRGLFFCYELAIFSCEFFIGIA